MSDPADRFRDLATVVAPAVRTAGFDDLHRRGRRRRARRTGVTVLAVVAGVALAVSAPSVAGFRPADTLSRITGGLLNNHPDYRGGGSGMVFVSSSTGYRFLTRCPTGPMRCELTLEATADGGRSWHSRPVPRLPLPAKDGANDPYVDVLGPRSLLLTTGDQRQLSIDGGRHWVAAPRKVTPPVAAASKSDLLRATCLNGPICARPRLVTINPATAGEAPLLHQPPADALNWAVVRGSDGSVWVPGRDAGGRTSVSASHDGGRTWITRPLPGMNTVSETMIKLVTLDGRTAYALIVTGSDARELPIARTGDGGKTWRRLPRAQGLHPASAIEAAVLPDGRLVIAQQQPHLGVFASSDGIRFERLAGVPALLSFQPFPGGLLATGNGQGPGNPKEGYGEAPGTRMYVTTDGKRWRALPWWDTDVPFGSGRGS